MKVFAILTGKIIYFFLSKLNKGTTITGSVALKIDKNLLRKFVMPKTVIAVTGSSGKGTTSALITKALRSAKKSVAYNDFGSNLRLGITSMLIINSKLSGKIKKDFLVVEIDERYVKEMFHYLNPNYVVITNITRDQPPRNGHFDIVIEEIKKGLSNEHLILNADDPLMHYFNNDNPTYYSINENDDCTKDMSPGSLNIVYCPKCHSKLKYNYYHLESYGDYYCEKCSFKRPEALYKFNYNINEGTIFNGKDKIKLDTNVLYDAFNKASAYTLLSLLDINFEKALDALNQVKFNENFYKVNDRDVYVFSCKNENNTSFNHPIKFVNRFSESKVIIIGWKEISRRYAHNDLSWLYDIDFDSLNNGNVERLLCVGPNKFDIATRMKIAGFDTSIISTFDYLEAATRYAKNKTSGNIFGILNFDYVDDFNKLMKVVDKK